MLVAIGDVEPDVHRVEVAVALDPLLAQLRRSLPSPESTAPLPTSVAPVDPAQTRAAAAQFGFVQYDACVVESLDLLKRKAGEEIVQQIYCFQDKSGRDLALRLGRTATEYSMASVVRDELASVASACRRAGKAAAVIVPASRPPMLAIRWPPRLPARNDGPRAAALIHSQPTSRSPPHTRIAAFRSAVT